MCAVSSDTKRRSRVTKGGRAACACGRRGQGLSFARVKEFSSNTAASVHPQYRIRDFGREKALSRHEVILTSNG